MYSITMPRVLTLRQGHLYAQPVEEMKALRIEASREEIAAEDTVQVTAGLHEGTEVLLDITFGSAQKVELTVAYGLERLVLRYDRQKQSMQIDRTGMKLGARGLRTFKLFADESLAVQLFLDRTAVEAFFQHGEQTASFLVFPEKNIVPELLVKADGAMQKVLGTVWELAAFQFNK